MVRNKDKIPAKKVFFYRNRIDFEFVVEGVTYNNRTGRIKINDGYLIFLIKEDNKWKPKKGELLKMKLVKERKLAGNTKKSA